MDGWRQSLPFDPEHTEMNIPGTPSLFFLAYLFLFLPWMAFRSHRRLQQRGPTPGEIRFSDSELERIWIGTLVQQVVLLTLAWLVGRDFQYSLWRWPPILLPTLVATLLALALCFVVRFALRSTMAPIERRSLLVYALAPRSRRQWCLKTLVVLCASLAEESAYRGVCWQIVAWSTDSFWLGTLLSAVAFAAVHRIQGWKSMLAIGLFAVNMQALVWHTHSLLPAMLVHAVYDCLAILLIARQAARQRQSSLEQAAS